MDEASVCPLFTVALLLRGDPGSAENAQLQNAKCLGELCQWWHKSGYSQRCALHAIATNIEAMMRRKR